MMHIENSPTGILGNVPFKREEFPRDRKFNRTNVNTPSYLYRVHISSWIGNDRYHIHKRRLSITSNLGGQIIALISNKLYISMGIFVPFRTNIIICEQ